MKKRIFVQKNSLPSFPNEKKESIKKKMFSYELQNTFSFSELENNYYLFNSVPKLSITIVTTSNTKEELFYILQLIKVILKKIKSKYNSNGRV